jgi:hypothetical protein
MKVTYHDLKHILLVLIITRHKNRIWLELVESQLSVKVINYLKKMVKLVKEEDTENHAIAINYTHPRKILPVPKYNISFLER